MNQTNRTPPIESVDHKLKFTYYKLKTNKNYLIN